MYPFDKISSSYINDGLNFFLNPYSYLFFRKNHYIIKNADSIMIDGFLLKVLYNFFLSGCIERKSFDMTSLAESVLANAELENKTISFIGSNENEINNFIKIISKRYPMLHIVFFRNGYFANQQRTEVINSIKKINPDIVIAGLGVPLQELFLIDLRKNGWRGTGFTCGGFIHQTSKGIQYYPDWINKFNLRWLYRIYDEPKLFRRYTIDYTKFLFLFFYDVFSFKISKLFKTN